MPNPDPSDIPFSASHNQQAFKLLELPPELLALLESADPPTLNLIPDPSPTGNGHALLCMPDKSLMYHVRQKNTSNPIHLLAPSNTEISIGDAGEEGEENEGLGICSIAMIEDTLELYKVEREEEGGKEKEKGGGKVGKWHEKFARGRVK